MAIEIEIHQVMDMCIMKLAIYIAAMFGFLTLYMVLEALSILFHEKFSIRHRALLICKLDTVCPQLMSRQI